MALLNHIKASLDAMVEKKKEMNKESGKIIKDALQKVLASDPDLKGIIWTQYTPYFNDGDPCVFQVMEPCMIYGETGDLDDVRYAYEHFVDGEETDAVSEFSSKYPRIVETEGLVDELGNLLGLFEESLEELFGGHVEVLVTAKNVVVREHDHE